eukprot:2288915-Rhodomonas_salina.3
MVQVDPRSLSGQRPEWSNLGLTRRRGWAVAGPFPWGVLAPEVYKLPRFVGVVACKRLQF